MLVRVTYLIDNFYSNYLPLTNYHINILPVPIAYTHVPFSILTWVGFFNAGHFTNVS